MKAVRRTDADVVFIKYFPWCFLLRLLVPRRRMVLDIRTGSVHINPVRRLLADAALRLECLFFRHISVISASLGDRLGIARRKRHILPLGANPLPDCRPRDYSQLNLLYVGTFNKRRIDDTLRGLSRFRQAHPEIPLHYRLVGSGPARETERLRQLAGTPFLQNVVELTGYIHHRQLQDYWQWANVGIAYIPITPAYEVQPPTKTFEYLAAGMSVLATATGENRRIITHENGVLIEDTPEAFAAGLWELYQRGNHYDCNRIQDSIAMYSWEKIVQNLFRELEAIAVSAPPCRKCPVGDEP